MGKLALDMQSQDKLKYVFVGNRKFVLEEMIALKLNLQVLVIKNTHLEKDNLLNNINHKIIQNKKELLDYINNNEFDILISNGCPHILPISKLKKKIYANIHPSFLPDLKGIDPCLGSILYSRDGGATCHIMDDTIDGGPIISRVKIPFSNDLDVSLMYQLSFLAEKKAFHDSFKKKFIANINPENGDWIYYSRKPGDRIIDFGENAEKIIQRIKTFSNKSQGCFFTYKNIEFKVYDAELITNDFVINHSKGFNDLDIIFNYEDSIIFKKDNKILKFTKVVGPINDLSKGTPINK